MVTSCDESIPLAGLPGFFLGMKSQMTLWPSDDGVKTIGRMGWKSSGYDWLTVPLVMTFTVCHGLLMALIEINGLPNLKMGGSFHGYV